MFVYEKPQKVITGKVEGKLTRRKIQYDNVLALSLFQKRSICLLMIA